MKRLLVTLLVSLLMLALVFGCGNKAEEKTDDAPAQTQETEIVDSAQLEAMPADTTMTDSVEVVPDSM